MSWGVSVQGVSGVSVQGVSVQGVSVQGVSDRGVCVLWGKYPGGTCPGGFYEPFHEKTVFME